MYDSMLANARITSAKYSLTFNAASGNNITYLLSYTTPASVVYDFEVAIVNN